MPAKTRDRFPIRIFILASFFLVWSAVLASRFVQLQIFQYADLSAKAERQQNRSFEISPQRGTIYDRLGRELPAPRRERVRPLLQAPRSEEDVV